MKETLKIEINSDSDKEKIEEFLKYKNLIFEWDNNNKLSKDELIEKLCDKSKFGSIKYFEDPTLPTGIDWENDLDTD